MRLQCKNLNWNVRVGLRTRLCGQLAPTSSGETSEETLSEALTNKNRVALCMILHWELSVKILGSISEAVARETAAKIGQHFVRLCIGSVLLKFRDFVVAVVIIVAVFAVMFVSVVSIVIVVFVVVVVVANVSDVVVADAVVVVVVSVVVAVVVVVIVFLLSLLLVLSSFLR